MKENQGNYAYVDGANLHKGIQSLCWSLTMRVFESGLGKSIMYKEHISLLGYFLRTPVYMNNYRGVGIFLCSNRSHMTATAK